MVRSRILTLLHFTIAIVGSSASPTSNGVFLSKREAAGNASVALPPIRELSVGVNSWDKISAGIDQQTFEWDDTDLTVYKNVAESTLSVISAVSNGDSWDVALLNVGKSIVPFIAMANPLLGLTVGVFLSFFGDGSKSISEIVHEGFKKLYKKIMKQVRTMFIDTIVEEEMRSVSQKISLVTKEIAFHPEYLLKSVSCEAGVTEKQCEDDWRKRRFTFWSEREQQLNSIMNDVFFPDCVNKQVDGPSASPDAMCRKFQKNGAMTFQFPVAMLHMHVLFELGRLSIAPTESHHYLLQAKVMAGTYHALLQDSFDYFKVENAKRIQCHYDLSEYCTLGGYSMCIGYHHILNPHVCNVCRAKLSHSSEIDPNTGRNIIEVLKKRLHIYCRTETIARNHRGSASRNAPPFRNTWRKGQCYSNYGGGCNGYHFSKYRDLWEGDLTKAYGPLLTSLLKASQIVV